jgi:RHS repeat-associated protein
VRAVFAGHANGRPELMKTTDYYPFGMLKRSGNPDLASGVMAQQSFYADTISPNRHLYNGKEVQNDVLVGTSTDWFDYGARMYDAELGRWHVVDNLAEKGFSISPYSYAFNNPICYLDPDGDWSWEQKSVRQARRFAFATDSKFVKSTRSYRKNEGIAATVFLHGTAAGYNVRQRYARLTGQGYGSSMSSEDQDNAQTVEFEDGGDYGYYFNPPDVILANSVAVGIVLEEILVVFPQVAPLLPGNESIDADNVAYDQVKNAKDNSKNEKHGDGGRAKTKAEKQIDDLINQKEGAARSEREKIERKIRTIRENADKKNKGEEHSRTNKR